MEQLPIILLDDQVAKLMDGYQKVCKAQLDSKTAWQRVFRARDSQYFKAHSEYIKRRNIGRIMLGISFLFILSGILLLFIAYPVFSLLLFFTGSLLLSGTLFWRRLDTKEKLPPDPQQDARLLDILPGWYNKLRGVLPPKDPDDYGQIGEYNFIERLKNSAESFSFIIYRLRLRQGDDVDVVIIGPKGVWVFEVKHWSGEVTYQNGIWKHIKTSGEEEFINEGLHKQWQRMADDVRREISFPMLNEIKGGIVFTIDKVTLRISPDCPTKYGKMDFWIKELRKSPSISGLDEAIILRVLDKLLVRHRRTRVRDRNIDQDISTVRFMDEDHYIKQLTRTANERLVAHLSKNKAPIKRNPQTTGSKMWA